MTPASYLQTDEATFYEKIFAEFGKTRKEVEEYVDILTEWGLQQLHWPEKPTLNGALYCILISKFSIENAKKRADMYYAIKGLMPEIFGVNPLSPAVIKHTEIAYCVPIPKPTKNHERIFYLQLNPNFNTEDFKFELFFIQITHMVEVIIQEDKCYNFHIIINANGAKIGHIARMQPMALKKMSLCFEKVYGYRVASVFVVNTHPYLDTFINQLAMHLAVEKIRNRMKLSRNADVLFEAFDKSLLPKDIGGEGLSLKELRLLLLKEFERMKPRFDRLQTMKTNESLRPEELLNDDTLGYYGNFKKLDVD